MTHYDTYGAYKAYATPTIGPKHIRRLDAEIWAPGECRTDMSFLEIGCGTGLFLGYLGAKGVEIYIGIDFDPALTEIVPETVRAHFHVADVWEFAEAEITNGTRYDRIMMFDVLEHFDAADGCRLLQKLKDLLAPNGQIHVKVPNAGSPWGQQFQYGDLTHKTAYTPESMRQQAYAAGYACRDIYAQQLGSPPRRRWEAMVHWVLDRVLTSPPDIWAGNFYAVLAPETENT
ncbi:MAG: class I SAM-dependent methyltransferase [Rhodospirillaceae bacterium]|jgi:2-polyprenyl-3-methyl-5-hydroxy-6-metoxy-1,4-benzoquinol methylase|nr:class I SAM-dependent methyltransferase [Rhodospirillaceae bacterium]MBT3909024.1 class I SAM-dependent methyltransferase [Rhodospirillaceae bacterium]MBT5299564.1 class I SAM-dependent methyltransferase [Rhodospirillaceae bacterium]MBT5513877.1 class I SAM-dependent methyltransferase [Rhodospirillaceae bacterium]MBT6085939.1 class I SAM-dependent methyltransferase [Rhodospirillaceae bacterium]